MTDFTREQAIEWCREMQCDFEAAVIPHSPPSGWMWGETGTDELILVPIFTMTDQGGAITKGEIYERL